MKYAVGKLLLCMLVMGVLSAPAVSQPAPTPGPNDMYIQFADFPSCGNYYVGDTLWYGAVIFNPSYTQTKTGNLRLEVNGPNGHNALTHTVAIRNLGPRETRTIDTPWRITDYPRPVGHYKGTYWLREHNTVVHVEQQKQNCVYVGQRKR